MITESPSFFKEGQVLLNMSVIGDMVLAAAVVALAPGAVTEFQLRKFGIRPAADGAAVGIGGFGLCHGGFVGTGGDKGNNLGAVLGRGGLMLAVPDQTGEIGPPGHGDHVGHILTEEEEIVGQSDD